MGEPFGLSAYLALSGPRERYADAQLARRLAKGKEDAARIDERRGIASLPRPLGTLIWFHAASVGESVSLLALLEDLLDHSPDLNILVTTGTRTSAQIMADRLPRDALHQFIPLDAKRYVARFLEHWKPDIAVWTESELWPSLIVQTSNLGIPMFLLNARMSKSSHGYWRWFRRSAMALLGRFDMIMAQDRQSAEYLAGLGADRSKVRVLGSLKQNSAALPYNEAERDDVAVQLQTRPVWLAASTHPGEETAAAEAHRKARRASPRLLLIIAPRHPERGPGIAAILRGDGWSVGLRSEGDDPVSRFEIYIADTLGEMGLWYRIAPVSFLGGSIAPVGGHNPLEPAALGSAIIHGPNIDNAREVYTRLADAGATRVVRNEIELANAVIDLLEPHMAAEMAHAAWEISSAGAEAAEAARMALLEAVDKVES